MKRILLFLFLLLAVRAMPAHAQGTERILALAPHVCEILYAIGAGDEIVGAVDYCDYPKAAEKLPRVGSYDRIHTEAAIALKPTLAIAPAEGVPGLEALRKLGVRIEISKPDTVRGVFDEIDRLGHITGHDAEAMRLSASLRKQLSELESLRPAMPIPVFYELWPDPLMTLGGKGFMQDVLTEAGLRNVFADMPLENARVNVESIIRMHPAIVIVPDEMRDVASRRKFWKHWLGPQVRVVSVDADLLQRPGPRLVDGIGKLIRDVAGDGK